MGRLGTKDYLKSLSEYSRFYEFSYNTGNQWIRRARKGEIEYPPFDEPHHMARWKRANFKSGRNGTGQGLVPQLWLKFEADGPEHKTEAPSTLDYELNFDSDGSGLEGALGKLKQLERLLSIQLERNQANERFQTILKSYQDLLKTMREVESAQVRLRKESHLMVSKADVQTALVRMHAQLRSGIVLSMTRAIRKAAPKVPEKEARAIGQEETDRLCANMDRVLEIEAEEDAA